MRRGMWLLAVCLAAAAAWAASSGARPVPRAPAVSLHVTVRPAIGNRATRFAVRFAARGGALSGASMERHYLVSATGPHRLGCLSAAAASAITTKTGAVQDVHLIPRHGHWCLGTFHGRITLVLTPICTGPMHACPMYAIEAGVVGRFSFRVR